MEARTRLQFRISKGHYRHASAVNPCSRRAQTQRVEGVAPPPTENGRSRFQWANNLREPSIITKRALQQDVTRLSLALQPPSHSSPSKEIVVPTHARFVLRRLRSNCVLSPSFPTNSPQTSFSLAGAGPSHSFCQRRRNEPKRWGTVLFIRPAKLPHTRR